MRTGAVHNSSDSFASNRANPSVPLSLDCIKVQHGTKSNVKYPKLDTVENISAYLEDLPLYNEIGVVLFLSAVEMSSVNSYPTKLSPYGN